MSETKAFTDEEIEKFKKDIEHDLYRKDLTYILDEKNNVVPATIHEWAEFRKTDRKIVKKEKVNGCFVSTVFIGVDHAFLDDEFHVFETMVFLLEKNSWVEEYCERYATYKEALEGHEKAVQWVKDGMPEE